MFEENFNSFNKKAIKNKNDHLLSYLLKNIFGNRGFNFDIKNIFGIWAYVVSVALPVSQNGIIQPPSGFSKCIMQTNSSLPKMQNIKDSLCTIIFYKFMSSVLELIAIMNRIVSTYCCYILLRNKISKNKVSYVLSYYKIINFLFCIASGLIFAYQLFSYEIARVDLFDQRLNRTKKIFELKHSNFSKNPFKTVLEMAAFIFRDGLNLPNQIKFVQKKDIILEKQFQH
ncbi:hypothetical protein BpHYR1_000940 [Brachionus plicatilis]|uniref:Uncharacterized protein n=1 Tax=Brachionus plicatilis TaxID=10195 RepID=A0A3M7T9P4_BRAPC|nr:hypothetical protein BpHYR1_000940 [Brachionus plicatilis]